MKGENYYSYISYEIFTRNVIYCILIWMNLGCDDILHRVHNFKICARLILDFCIVSTFFWCFHEILWKLHAVSFVSLWTASVVSVRKFDRSFLNKPNCPPPCLLLNRFIFVVTKEGMEGFGEVKFCSSCFLPNLKKKWN